MLQRVSLVVGELLVRTIVAVHLMKKVSASVTVLTDAPNVHKVKLTTRDSLW